LRNFIKNNLCKVSWRWARDRDPSRPRRDLRDRDFKNGSGDASRDRVQVSRLHHWRSHDK